jgi:alpha-tubulin suppressor-like RCC1 family protein
VYAWGDNASGACGVAEEVLEKPTPIPFFSSLGQKVVKVKAAGEHSAALTEQGQVFVWGSNAFGQLGAGEDVKVLSTPRPIDDNAYSKVWLGNTTLMLQTQAGQLRAAGMKLWPSLSPIDAPRPVKAAVCGHDYFAVLLDDGSFLHFNGAFGLHKKAGSLSGSIDMTEAGFLKGEVLGLTGSYNYTGAVVL